MRKRRTGDKIMTHRELYKDPVNGKLTGVCAGLANYFGLEVWLVRILFISAALFSGFFLVMLAYFALSLMLEKQPENFVQAMKSKKEHSLKSKPWQQGQNAKDLLSTLERDFDSMEHKVRDMEAYVTSEAFKVNREFSKL
ncbi:envelope stress response membrane protein PspC [Vibrio maritimus]|uniref:envelope stress response membrane protein PspC n=1 Tax=Vibrio maritimus TaxID=990268 RepID=UPI003736BE3E